MTRAGHDPTRSGAPVPDRGHHARLSRSEVEAVAFKATRGAGFEWGLAEEAGMAARRLVEAGVPGPDLLLACLEAPRGAVPRIDGGNWRAPSNELLCPLATGSALSDRAGMDEGPGGRPGVNEIVLHRLGHPALILPFVMQAAARLGMAFRVSWEGTETIATPDGLLSVQSDTLEAPQASEVEISTLTELPPPLMPVQTGCRVALDVWRRLDALALMTTVPATTSSRAGAGSGSTDND